MKSAQREKLFRSFLEESEILISDKSSASRRRLVKTLVDMGAKRQSIHSVAHFSEAKDIIDTNKPKLILSDYSLNGGSGFDLFRYYREVYPDEKKSALILVTSNISQSAVAKAAEEDVDSFIIKPYTVNSLEKSLIDTILLKLYPSKYIQTIEEGKEKLFKGEFNTALELFETATKLNPKPSLALFYLGQTRYFMDSKDQAESNYKRGLEINSIHYKCQIGLYEMFKMDGNNKEAYNIVKNIAKYFPANPNRLKEVISLAVKTQNYKDIENYYEIFLGLEERTDDIIGHICSGMYICGKNYLMSDEPEKACDIYEKSAIVASGRTKFLSAMIISLVENEIFEKARDLLSRFDIDSYGSHDYGVSSFLANSNEMTDIEIISKGSELFNKGFKHPLCAKYLIDSLEKEKAFKKARNYREEASYIWPDLFKAPGKSAA